MSAPVVYMSTDASAPSLTGEVGSLVALLDAVLVNGYGSQPAAGWTKAFSGTNKAAYRMGSGVLGYVRIQDDAPGVGGAREARWRGYEAMSAVDTGTGPFPTTVHHANGLVCRKSNTLDAVVRPWIVVADDRTFYLFTQHKATVLDNTDTFSIGFGEFYSFVPADSFRMFALGRVEEGAADNGFFNLHTEPLCRGNGPASATSTFGEFMARNWTGDGAFGATRAAHWAFVGRANASHLGDGVIPYPNPAEGGLYTGPVWIGEFTGGGAHVRGKLRGLWNPLHAYTSFNTGQLLAGTGDCSDKTFMAIRDVFGLTNFRACTFLETSDTWLTN